MSIDSNIETLIIVRDDDDDDDDIEEIEIPVTSHENNQRCLNKRSYESLDSQSESFSRAFTISYVTFAGVSNIITISRSESTFYCIEDIYSKIFETICTYEEFMDYLAQDDQIFMKETTLSEKFTIDEHNSNLKIYNPIRYHLILIETSTYLLQLKQYLINNQFDNVSQRFETSTPDCSMPTIINIEENVQITQQKNLISNKEPVILRKLLTRVAPTCISFSQAISERNHSNFDDLHRLVIRHQKVFLTRPIDTLGELFPTWFVHPTYRCIHCFTCDQVYTPHMFMMHVDDEELINEKPVTISSIQLLTSERISKKKVNLWNKFCLNLKLHAKEGHLDGSKDFLID